MADKPTEKKLTPEEQRALIVKNTLEFKLLQTSIGYNLAKSNQGDWGEYGIMAATVAYNNAINSPDGQKERKTLQEQKEAEYKQYGVVGEAFVPNADLSLKFAKQLEEVMHMAKFGEIEKYAKDLGAKLDFRVPEEMKNYSLAEILKTAVDKEKGIIDLTKLSDSNKEAYNFYEKVLSRVYERACVVSTLKGADYFADINAQAKQFGDKYALPKEEPKSKEGQKPKQGGK
jgi:hypothetical protein